MCDRVALEKGFTPLEPHALREKSGSNGGVKMRDLVGTILKKLLEEFEGPKQCLTATGFFVLNRG